MNMWIDAILIAIIVDGTVILGAVVVGAIISAIRDWRNCHE